MKLTRRQALRAGATVAVAGAALELPLWLAGREANAINLVPPNEKGAFDASHVMGFQVMDIRDRVDLLFDAAKAAGAKPIGLLTSSD